MGYDMAKPSIFKISVYPAEVSEHFVTVEITRCVKRGEVEATLETVRDKMREMGQSAAKEAGVACVQVSCYPAGRAPNGFKEFQAARKNQMTMTIGMYVGAVAA